MVSYLLKFRYLAVIVILFSIVNAIALLVLGVYEAFHAYRDILAGPPWKQGGGPGISIVYSIDIFLVAMVLIVLAVGVGELFIIPEDKSDDLPIPSWMRIKSFLELKLLLWEAVLTVLVVAFLGHVVAQGEVLNWETIILPASILLLAVSLFIMKKISGGMHQ